MSSPETVPAQLPATPTADAADPFASMHDLRCPVTVWLGTGGISVRRCLELAPDSVVVLRESAGDDLELRVNGVLLARGEVVMVDGATSFRVTTVDVSEEAGG